MPAAATATATAANYASVVVIVGTAAVGAADASVLSAT